MVIVQVYIRVYTKDIDDFISATIHNAKNSLEEPGIIRFDFMQEINDPQSFLLTEIYKDKNAPLEHKKTKHYMDWREGVADMMESPRQGVKFKEIYPTTMESWKTINE